MSHMNSIFPTAAAVVCIAAGKGGVGSTTIAVTLSAELGRDTELRPGKKTALIDADPQGAAAAWLAASPSHMRLPIDIFPSPAAGRNLSREIEALSRSYEVIVVDLPKGLREEAPASALLVGSLCISPTRCSPPDVRACLIDTAAMVQNARRLNGHLQYRILANLYRRTNVASNLLAVMEGCGAPLLKSRIGDRTAFQLAAGIGSVPAMMGAAHRLAATEVALVAQEVRGLLFGGAA